jgi:carboxymethylenebutenolidase
MTYPTKRILAGILLALASACARSTQQAANDSHDHVSSVNATMVASGSLSLPPDGAGALERLRASPRHGEWVDIPTSATDSVRAWVVYPERSTKAPVVVVIHENTGLTPWARAVADQLAAEGFIAIAPNLLTMKHLAGEPDSVDQQTAIAANRTLTVANVQRDLTAAAKYAMSLPSALHRYGVVGFCVGGEKSFQHAVTSANLSAAVVFYGQPPVVDSLKRITAPVLGLYGGSDARITATVPVTDSAMRALGKTYSYQIFEGAGHGFMRQQSGMNGANALAASKGWPLAISWFRKHLGT